MSSQESRAKLTAFEAAREQTLNTNERGRARAAGFAPARPSLLLPAVSLWWRELIRFYRQPSRWVGVLLSPLVFWLVIGAGLGDSFRAPVGAVAGGYLEYFFPGTLTLILLFTSIFCMMSVIEDRREGFLASVLVSPAPRASIALGKILGGATLATLQAALFLLLAPLVGISLSIAQVAASLGVMFLIAFGLTGLGFCLAWRLDSTHGFHALVNLFLVPMWLLSGALFPLSGAQAWIGWLMLANPLTYGMSLLRHTLYASAPGEAISLPVAFGVTTLAAIVSFLAALWIASGRGKK